MPVTEAFRHSRPYQPSSGVRVVGRRSRLSRILNRLRVATDTFTMSTVDERPRVVARSDNYAWGMSAVFILFALLLSTPFFQSGGHDRTGLIISSAVIDVLMAILIFRTWRGSTVIADSNGVVARSILRTRRWRWDEVREFAANTRPIGAVAYPRRTLAVILADGRTHWCTDISARPTRDATSTWIDEAAQRLNDRRPTESQVPQAA